MSKHKHFHGLGGKGSFAKGAALYAKRYAGLLPPKKKAPASAANTDRGKAEHVDHAVSASNDSTEMEEKSNDRN